MTSYVIIAVVAMISAAAIGFAIAQLLIAVMDGERPKAKRTRRLTGERTAARTGTEELADAS